MFIYVCHKSTWWYLFWRDDTVYEAHDTYAAWSACGREAIARASTRAALGTPRGRLLLMAVGRTRAPGLTACAAGRRAFACPRTDEWLQLMFSNSRLRSLPTYRGARPLFVVLVSSFRPSEILLARLSNGGF